MIDYYLTLLNATICILIVLRLLTYQRNGARYRPMASLLAYVLTISFALVPIRVFWGHYQTVEPSELLINILICIVFYKTKGNVMQLLNIGIKNGV